MVSVFEQQKIALKHFNIDIDIIDEDCRDMVIFFNEMGLTTKYCCSGHNTSIYQVMFADNVTDKMIGDFLYSLLPINETGEIRRTLVQQKGTFTKWARAIDGEIIYNWEYIVDMPMKNTNIINALEDLALMKQLLK